MRQFCEVCREGLREYDLFARYGGEEFALVLPESGAEQAEAVAESYASPLLAKISNTIITAAISLPVLACSPWPLLRNLTARTI
ncbi:MAG: diguanylate cyclase [Syntrophotaleaceae bacterium]